MNTYVCMLCLRSRTNDTAPGNYTYICRHAVSTHFIVRRKQKTSSTRASENKLKRIPGREEDRKTCRESINLLCNVLCVWECVCVGNTKCKVNKVKVNLIRTIRRFYFKRRRKHTAYTAYAGQSFSLIISIISFLVFEALHNQFVE